MHFHEVESKFPALLGGGGTHSSSSTEIGTFANFVVAHITSLEAIVIGLNSLEVGCAGLDDTKIAKNFV